VKRPLAHPVAIHLCRSQRSPGTKLMERWKAATMCGAAHFFLQVSVYVFGFALGPAGTTRKVIGISFYDAAVVITFPFVYLAEHFQWNALGIGAFPLNSLLWTCVVYVILWATRRRATLKRR
jgi:hypothetical protein